MNGDERRCRRTDDRGRNPNPHQPKETQKGEKSSPAALGWGRRADRRPTTDYRLLPFEPEPCEDDGRSAAARPSAGTKINSHKGTKPQRKERSYPGAPYLVILVAWCENNS
jgi:hypothetical protein